MCLSLLSSPHIMVLSVRCRIPSHRSCQQRRELVWGVIQLKCALQRRWWSTGTLRWKNLIWYRVKTLVSHWWMIIISGYFTLLISLYLVPFSKLSSAILSFLVWYWFLSLFSPLGKLSSLPAQCPKSLFRERTDQGLQVWQHHDCQGKQWKQS